MTSDREKLIELIFASGCVSGFAGSLADYLINHGVRLETKQATSDKTSDSKWIPISELPTEDGYYWCVDKDGDFFDAFYSEEEKSFGVVCSIWNTETFEKDDEWCAYDVTHWMPLPQPPGEE